jgi:surface polysaccharide O-acyltransferase-like enzyme
MTNSPPTNNNRIVYLDSIRTVAVFMVVGIHTMGYIPLVGMERTIIAFLVHTVAVPVFFLVDGVIFSRQIQRKPEFNYFEYLLKSARRLLIPWAVFSILYLILRGLFEFSGFVSQQIILTSSFSEILHALYVSHVSNQMYFLLSLFFIRAFAFAWQRLAKAPRGAIALVWAGYTAILLLLAPQIADLSPSGLDPVLNAIMGLRFYLLGVAVFRYQALLERYSLCGVSFALILGISLRLFSSAGIHVQIPLLLCLYISFLCFFNQQNILSATGRFTMGIYLLHVPIILKAVSLIFLQINKGGAMIFVAVLVTTFIISLGFAKLLDSFFVWRFAVGQHNSPAAIN